jgi:thiol-disulfide isomerase/thioredoxin
MLKKSIRPLAIVALALVATIAALYVGNRAPVVPTLAAADTDAGKPLVIKLHAQWCAFCLMTKDEWSRIEETYKGRVNFVVFDFTTDEKAGASRAEARRLGLESFFDEFEGVTGTIAVLDGRTKQVAAELHGSRDFEEYRAAIDAAVLASR